MVKETHEKQLLIYSDSYGKEPWVEWISSLKDPVTRKRIFSRIRQIQAGNYGDCKPVGEGVLELRLFFGAGYRFYFGELEKGGIVLLLCGGDKSTQEKDIKQAKVFWREYNAQIENI